MKTRAGSDVAGVLIAMPGNNQRSAIRREQMRWANLNVEMVAADLAMAYVADVIEAEAAHLLLPSADIRSVEEKLIAVVAYLRQQVVNLRV